MESLDPSLVIFKEKGRREVDTKENVPALSSRVQREKVELITLNVGGRIYRLPAHALHRDKTSWISRICTSPDEKKVKDKEGRYFFDRDGETFFYISQYLENGTINLPKYFNEVDLLRQEAIYYGLNTFLLKINDYEMKQAIRTEGEKYIGKYITVTEHSTFNVRFRNNVEVGFKRTSSITVSGHVGTCREIFGPHLSLKYD